MGGVVSAGGWVIALLLFVAFIATRTPRDPAASARCMCGHRRRRHAYSVTKLDDLCLLCDGLPCLGFRPVPRRHVHWHRLIAVRSGNHYFACRCGSRRASMPQRGCVSPLDGKWLRTGAWTTEEDLRNIRPPRGPSGSSSANRPAGMPTRGPTGGSGQAKAR